MAYKHPSKEAMHQGRIHSKVIDAGEQEAPGMKCHNPEPVGPRQEKSKKITHMDLNPERPSSLAAPLGHGTDGDYDDVGGY